MNATTTRPLPAFVARRLPLPLTERLQPLHARLVGLVERLPQAPPSFALCKALDRVLWPRLPEDARAALRGRTVALQVTDFGVKVRLRVGEQGFEVAGAEDEVALTIRATSEGFLLLARGEDDPDRLFFERKLLMEGDTELGLVLKNTLDAIGPLWR